MVLSCMGMNAAFVSFSWVLTIPILIKVYLMSYLAALYPNLDPVTERGYD